MLTLSSVEAPTKTSKTGTLVHTKVPNQPLLRVINGNVYLKNLSLDHCSAVDLSTSLIKPNNNAAVFVNPPSSEDE